jgi:hypothetical protein
MADQANITDSEEWRDVVGWEGLYQVSSHGRVRSLARMVRSRGGCLVSRGGSIRKTPVSNKLGHRNVMLCRAGGNRTILVHILVCEAFHGPKPSPHHEVAHWDGVGGNNRKDNLRWATKKENADDRGRHGRHQIGPKNVNARLNREKVRAIRSAKAVGARSDTLAAKYGVSVVTINNIIARNTWKHVE